VCRVYVRWLRVIFFVAGAFQPEICSLRLACIENAAGGGRGGGCLRFGSREAAKPRREGSGSLVRGRFSSTSTVRQGGLSTSTR